MDELNCIATEPEAPTFHNLVGHYYEVRLNFDLFAMIKQIYDAKLALDPESERKEYYDDCLREGANLEDEKKTELEINKKVVELDDTEVSE